MATAQDDVTGDGTTSNVLIIGELLKQAEMYISEVPFEYSFILKLSHCRDSGLLLDKVSVFFKGTPSSFGYGRIWNCQEQIPGSAGWNKSAKHNGPWHADQRRPNFTADESSSWFGGFTYRGRLFDRVSTSTGKRHSGKIREVFPVKEKSGNFKFLPGSQGICGQSGKIRSAKHFKNSHRKYKTVVFRHSFIED